LNPEYDLGEGGDPVGRATQLDVAIPSRWNG
jgi:hypothetical protein